MTLDARRWLQAARDTFTGDEIVALDEFLSNVSISALPSVIDGGTVVWLFTGERSQVALPFALLPEMTAVARESGLLRKFYDTFVEEVSGLTSAVHRSLFGET